LLFSFNGVQHVLWEFSGKGNDRAVICYYPIDTLSQMYVASRADARFSFPREHIKQFHIHAFDGHYSFIAQSMSSFSHSYLCFIISSSLVLPVQRVLANIAFNIAILDPVSPVQIPIMTLGSGPRRVHKQIPRHCLQPRPANP
jgi:hypothetical protein